MSVWDSHGRPFRDESEPPQRQPGWHEYLDLVRRVQVLEGIEDRRRRESDRDTKLLDAAAFVVATAVTLGQLEDSCHEPNPKR